MNKYIKLLTLSGVLAGAAACTDLDTPIEKFYVEFPNNPIATEAEFNKCYHYLRNEGWLGRNFWETVFMFGDEAMAVNFQGNYFDNGRYFYCGVHDMRPDHMSGGQEVDLMSGMTVTNDVIRNYGGADGKDAIVAPLRAIRAFYMFLFMDLYGDTPIMDRKLDDGEVFERSPRADVARFIEQELLEIIPDLSEENNQGTYGTPNKWMAEALLVKLYLNWGVYTNPIESVDNNTPNEKLADCVYWCDELINSGVFEVGQGYRRKFYPDNGLQIKDFIYAMPFDPETLGNGYWGGWQPNRFWDFRSITLCEPATWGWTPGEKPAGVFVMTPEAVDRFCLEGDERNDMVAVGQMYGYDASFNKTDVPVMVYTDARHRKEFGPLVYQKEFEFESISTFDVGAESDLNNLMKGARLFKYPPMEIDYMTGRWDKAGLQGNDFPIFRLADIYLTKAECILRGAAATNGQSAADCINVVRDCASAPHITNPTLQDVLDERGRELIMEMWRRNDLIRFGQFEDDWGWKNVVNPAAKTDKWRRLLPLSTGTMNTNTNWTQNPGY